MSPARVCVATCRDSAEAALVRALLAGHGIAAVVAGEQHASMLGGLAFFVRLDVWVDREDAEQAAALIESMRAGEGSDAVAEEQEANDDEPGPTTHWGIELRRRTGVTLLLAIAITFGTGHMYAGAWLRALLLAAIEIVGFRELAADRALGGVIVAAVVLFDAVGATILVRRQVRADQLPRAQARSRSTT